MKAIFKKLWDNSRKDALDSVDSFRKATRGFGYTGKEIDNALDGFSLGDDDLEWVAGGYPRPSKQGSTIDRNN